MALKVIGAGFPRTGTNSLKRSLEMLGISKTYHFKDLVKNPDKLPHWERLEQTNTTDWEAIYDGYQGSVDFPCYPWYKEHMEVYPDAKVILTVRPFEDWYASIKSTIWVSGPQTPIEKLTFMGKMAIDSNLRKTIKCVKFVKKFLWERQFEGRFLDKEFVKSSDVQGQLKKKITRVQKLKIREDIKVKLTGSYKEFKVEITPTDTKHAPKILAMLKIKEK